MCKTNLTPKAPYPHWQPLYDRLPGCHLLDTADLMGRRLLAVWALNPTDGCDIGDVEAESFWLQFAGDDAQHTVWLATDWVMNFFDKMWYLLPRAVVAPHLPSDGQQPPLQPLPGDRWYRKPVWQALCGLTLTAADVADPYQQHVAALALRYAPDKPSPDTPQPPHSASLLFDWGAGHEECDSTALVVSDDANIGRWPLRGQVQLWLDSPRSDWTVPWNSPPPPWNNEAHWPALVAFRQQWQAWLVTHTAHLTIEPLAQRVPMLGAAYRLLEKLVAFELALGHGLFWQAGHDLQTGLAAGFEPSYVSGHGTDHQALAEDVLAAVQSAWPLFATDNTQPSRPLAWTHVHTAYHAWWPLFRNLTHGDTA